MPERHLLYVVVPGIRNYLEFGGAGILVFDRDQDFQFVKRIATPASRAGETGEHQGRLRFDRHGGGFTSRRPRSCIAWIC